MPNLLDKRKNHRTAKGQVALFRLMDGHGVPVQEGECFIDDLSEYGAGLRVPVPFYRGDRLQLVFESDGHLYETEGIVCRDINWSGRTGVAFSGWNRV